MPRPDWLITGAYGIRPLNSARSEIRRIDRVFEVAGEGFFSHSGADSPPTYVEQAPWEEAEAAWEPVYTDQEAFLRDTNPSQGIRPSWIRNGVTLNHPSGRHAIITGVLGPRIVCREVEQVGQTGWAVGSTPGTFDLTTAEALTWTPTDPIRLQPEQIFEGLVFREFWTSTRYRVTSMDMSRSEIVLIGPHADRNYLPFNYDPYVWQPMQAETANYSHGWTRIRDGREPSPPVEPRSRFDRDFDVEGE